jgi:hypothetical protein
MKSNNWTKKIKKYRIGFIFSLNKLILFLFFCLFCTALSNAQTTPQPYVYVAGSFMDGNIEKACYWVNAERRDLPNGTRTVAITVVDGKVYVAGYTTTIALNRANETIHRICYWVDGVQFILNPNYNGYRQEYEVQDISVINGQVYLVGRYSDSWSSGWKSYYWVGDTGYNLNSESTGILGIADEEGVPYFVGSTWYSAYGQRINLNSIARSIAVVDGDVFIPGTFSSQDRRRPCYWLNGTRNDLPIHNNANNFNYYARSVAIVDRLIYVAGGYTSTSDSNFSKGCYWIGRERKELIEDGVNVTGMAVSEGKVYLSGTFLQGSIVRACYWIDGERRNLSAGRTTSGIFVVVR